MRLSVEGLIANIGSEVETEINVQLKINGKIEKTTKIDTLVAGSEVNQQISVDLDLTEMNSEFIAVELVVVPVEHEKSKRNNMKTSTIPILGTSTETIFPQFKVLETMEQSGGQ